MTYHFKTKPYEHQLEAFERSKDLPFFALLFEQGTGKTKVGVDTTGHLFSEDKVDGLFVLAPPGVHRDWVNDAIPDHMPDYIAGQTVAHPYVASKAATKTHQNEVAKVIAAPGLAMLTMPYTSILTPRGKDAANKMLMNRRCVFICDESTNIKTPNAKRTKKIVAGGKYAPYRRIMDGTPITQGAFDIYAPFRFLDPDIWRSRGMATFGAFKHKYGVFRQEQNRSGRYYEILLRHQNLDELAQIVDMYGMRVLKEDCLDLPPKVYSKRHFYMNDEQAREYRLVAEDIRQTNFDSEPMLAITRLLRLQQIASGFTVFEDIDGEQQIKQLGDNNPRLDTLVDICEGLHHQAIIWAKFTRDIDLICEALKGNCVRYDGQVDDETRANNKADFLAGKKQFFVANPAAAATGLTLTCAKSVIYYNNSFKLGDRLQSEDRAHRIGQDQSVHYIDLLAVDTIDERILEALRDKKNIADLITGDDVKDWL